jgi:hypothetical protein
MVNNKRGWIRILEATVAVLIISSVLIIVYSGQPKRADISNEVSDLQKKILRDISSNSNLRSDVINGNYIPLEEYIKIKIPAHFDFSLKICELLQPCKLDNDIFVTISNKEIFVEEIIISADLTEYNPKKVKLFVWRK